MFEIIFMAVVISIIVNRIQKSRKGQGRDGERQQPNAVPTHVPNERGGVRNASAQKAAGGQGSAGRAPAPQRVPGRPAKREDARDAVREAREDGNATTAYLMEKAQEDAKEHAREKYEEQKRLAASRGGLPVAERYLLGDAVPQGKRIVNCGYCGAENLVPMTPRTRYSCYFCRETL